MSWFTIWLNKFTEHFQWTSQWYILFYFHWTTDQLSSLILGMYIRTWTSKLSTCILSWCSLYKIYKWWYSLQFHIQCKYTWSIQQFSCFLGCSKVKHLCMHTAIVYICTYILELLCCPIALLPDIKQSIILWICDCLSENQSSSHFHNYLYLQYSS